MKPCRPKAFLANYKAAPFSLVSGSHVIRSSDLFGDLDHPGDGLSAHQVPLLGLLECGLSFLLIEVVVAAGEALHGYQEVPESGLELGPLVACVEKLPHEGLDLDLVKVREEGVDTVDQEADNEVFVCWETMRGPVFLVDRSLDNAAAGFHGTEHLLKDQPLKFEAADVSIVGHYCEDVSNDQEVEVLIED